MTPTINCNYETEYWDEDVMFTFQGECISEQPIENGCYIFESGGEEIEVDTKDIIREVSRELA